MTDAPHTTIQDWLRAEAALWSADGAPPIDARKLSQAADEIERLQRERDDLSLRLAVAEWMARANEFFGSPRPPYQTSGDDR